ncbi:MAG TPA: winged helix-turn-helix transcriptional regulator [Acidimicrobiales bacterium]|nr:winged helix-turn-helix transcriptional regulator [Acidimicrobiales bacterium]
MPDSDDSEPTGRGQYCPVSRAVDLLGERWTMLIVRDMLVGACRFNDLARGLPGLSRSLLTKRLRQLERSGLVDRLDGEYHLTEAGEALRPIVFGLGEWGAKYIFGEPRPSELDPDLLMWWVHKRIDTAQLPPRRTVLHFRFADDPRRYWIVIDSQGPSVCDFDPGFDVDVTVTADVATLHRVWLGHEPITDAMRAGRLAFEGPRALTRRMPDALLLSEIAGAVRAAR